MATSIKASSSRKSSVELSKGTAVTVPLLIVAAGGGVMNRIYAGFSISIVICGLTCLIALDSVLQTKSPEIPEEKKIKVKTELMEVRAVVTDRKGTIIENLRHEDFELLENGKQQEISFFSISKVEREQGRTDVKMELPTGQITEPQPSTLRRLTEAPVRTILLYADTLHLSFSSLNAVKDALRRYVNEKLTDQDMVALATSGSTLGVSQQFTRDKQLLRYAIEQIRFGTHSNFNNSLFTPILASDVLKEAERPASGGGAKLLSNQSNLSPDLGRGSIAPSSNTPAIQLAVDLVRREDGIICCSAALPYAMGPASALPPAAFPYRLKVKS